MANHINIIHNCQALWKPGIEKSATVPKKAYACVLWKRAWVVLALPYHCARSINKWSSGQMAQDLPEILQAGLNVCIVMCSRLMDICLWKISLGQDKLISTFNKFCKIHTQMQGKSQMTSRKWSRLSSRGDEENETRKTWGVRGSKEGNTKLWLTFVGCILC